MAMTTPASEPANRRILVIDMPDAGQAAVLAARSAINRASPDYFRGIVSNAVLSGYSGRLNWEISRQARIELWRGQLARHSSLGGIVQRDSPDKRTSRGAEVASLTLAEISKLATASCRTLN